MAHTDMTRTLAALFFAALTLCAGGTSAATATAASLTAEAEALLDESLGEAPGVEDVVRKLQAALALDSGYARAYVQLARLQIVGGQELGGAFATLGATRLTITGTISPIVSFTAPAGTSHGTATASSFSARGGGITANAGTPCGSTGLLPCARFPSSASTLRVSVWTARASSCLLPFPVS